MGRREQEPLRSWLALLLGAAPGLVAQAPGEGLVSFRQALLDASADTRVAILATHPDDPYFGLGLLLRRVWGCDVTVVLATRGEGGQNAVGPELGQELARIRTGETLAAAAVLDVQVRCLDLPDFGYSRTAAETLDRWRRHEPVRRLVAVLADLQPDLVILPQSPADPHGQKRALLHLLPEALRGLKEPRPRWFRGVAPGELPTVVLDLDRPDPLRGSTYQEEAYRALRLHRTQEPHRPLAEAVPARLMLRAEPFAATLPLLEGLPSLWETEGSADLDRCLAAAEGPTAAELQSRLERLPQIARDRASGQDPLALALDLLAIGRRVLPRLTAGSDPAKRLARRVEALGRAVLAGAVVRLEWEVPAALPPGQGLVPAPLRLWNESPWRVTLRVTSPAEAALVRVVLPEPSGTLRVGPGQGETLDLRLAGSPETSAAADCELVLPVRIDLAQTSIETVLARSTRLGPSLTIAAEPEARFLVPASGGDVRLGLRLTNASDVARRGLLAMAGPPGVTFLPEADGDEQPIRVELAAMSEALVPVRLRLPPVALPAAPPAPRAVSFYLGALAGETLPDNACQVRLEPVDVRVPQGLRLALVRGPDNTIEVTLRALGLDVEVLDPRSLVLRSLDDFDTVLVDSRALLQRPDLRAQTARFLAHARRGGHLVVLYHKAQEFNADEGGVPLAPYPLRLGTERVTREDAPVQLALPDHPLLASPNRLAVRDFDGWVHERGLYFPDRYDARYAEPLSIQELPMHEIDGVPGAEGELRFEPLRGGLLHAEVAAGSYVYCALVVHRQLRAFHAGAARLLVNLITPRGWPAFR